MKNEQVNNNLKLVKALSSKQEFNLKDRLLFDKLIGHKDLRPESRTKFNVDSDAASKSKNLNRTQSREDQVNNVDNVSNIIMPEIAILPVSVPVVWQNILQQVRLYSGSNNDFNILQAVLKHEFLPNTTLNIHKQNGVIMIQFVTDSSVMADSLFSQLRALKVYLEDQLNNPVHITLRSGAVQDHAEIDRWKNPTQEKNKG